MRMPDPQNDLERLLLTMDVAVQPFALCEIAEGRRLLADPNDAIMVYYVLSGTMYLSVGNGEAVACGTGSVTLLPPGLAPTLSSSAGPAAAVVGAQHTRANNGLLVVDAADGGVGSLRIAVGVVLASLSGSFGLLDKLKTPVTERVNDMQIVRHTFEMMMKEMSRPSIGGRALTSSLMKTCLLLCLRRFFVRPEAEAALLGTVGDPRLADAVELVLEKPSEPHTVASLAARAAMSRSNFARAFAQEFGMPPMEFVAKTRLRHAAEMLRSSKLPIKVIAASIGFSSRSHFSKAFHDAYGTDPTSFRAQAASSTADAEPPASNSQRVAVPGPGAGLP